jgi:hypothetical protein
VIRAFSPTPRMREGASRAVLVKIAICAVTVGACSTVPTGKTLDRSAGGACAIVEVARDTLLTPARERVFVAPGSVATNALEEVLIVGRPNYVFGADSGGASTLLAQDSLLGILVRPGGAAIEVPAPRDARRISVVEAFARDDGGWDVIFGEDAEPYALWDRPAWDPVHALWYGVLRGTAWESLEEIPIPQGWRVHVTESHAHARGVLHGAITPSAIVSTSIRRRDSFGSDRSDAAKSWAEPRVSNHAGPVTGPAGASVR